MRPGTVVVNKSTMPVGSTRFVQRVLVRGRRRAPDVGVASNPEFLREGAAVRDFLNPDRIVIGCDDPESAVRVSELYKGVQAPILVTDPASAEMIKYASNAFLATKVSFINAIANLCEAVDADVREVALGMGYDHRIGFEFLHPGPGYGGSCFPKDTAALLHTAGEAGYDFSLLRGVVDVNRAQHERMVDEGRARRPAARLNGVRSSAWGSRSRPTPTTCATRPRSSSPAASSKRAPSCGLRPGRRERRPSWCPASRSLDRSLRRLRHGATVLALLTEWDEFRWLDFDACARPMRRPAIVDARNLLDPAAMRRRGFAYQGVGR